MTSVDLKNTGPYPHPSHASHEMMVPPDGTVAVPSMGPPPAAHYPDGSSYPPPQYPFIPMMDGTSGDMMYYVPTSYYGAPSTTWIIPPGTPGVPHMAQPMPAHFNMSAAQP